MNAPRFEDMKTAMAIALGARIAAQDGKRRFAKGEF
jgi:hypothetical protein